MIISRTPYRISFFGGGTDYPGWFRQHGGAVLATSIDKYCHITCRHLPPFFEHRIRVVYSKIESVMRPEELQHPAVREILRFLEIGRGVEIHHDGDLPARSGMGSSSAFAVGLLNALYALLGQMPSKRQLAQEAIHIEQTVLQETVGSQDQVAAAFGGFNHINFHPNGDFTVRPVTLPAERIEELQDHLMLVYTGVKRTASDVASSYVGNLDAKRRQLRIMKDLVDEAVQMLASTAPISGFGELLHEGWMAKRALSEQVSNHVVDELYEAARTNGAVGGKLLGAGGGGFVLLFVPPERKAGLLDRLDGLIEVPFRFEHSGSQIIHMDREQDYQVAEQRREGRVIRPFEELATLTSARLRGEG